MPNEVAFETKADVREVAITVHGGKTLRVKAGKPHVTSDGDEIAVLNAAEGIRRTSSPKKTAAKKAANQGSPKKPRAGKDSASASTSTSGALASAGKEE